MAARAKAKVWAEGRGKKTDRQKTEERVRESVATHKPISIVESSITRAIESHDRMHQKNAERITAAGQDTPVGTSSHGYARGEEGKRADPPKPYFEPQGQDHLGDRYSLEMPIGYRPSTKVLEQMHDTPTHGMGALRYFTGAGAEKLEPLLQRDHAQALHDRASKDHEATAKQHVALAAATTQKYAADIAAARSETAHETGSPEDHFEAHKAHALAAQITKVAAENAERKAEYHTSMDDEGRGGKVGTRTDETHGQAAERWKKEADRLHEQAKDHAVRSDEHASLMGSGKGIDLSATMRSETAMGGTDSARGHEKIKEIEQHISAAVDHKTMSKAHREESKKEDPRMGGAWDDLHPRDEHGRFAAK